MSKATACTVIRIIAPITKKRIEKDREKRNDLKGTRESVGLRPRDPNSVSPCENELRAVSEENPRKIRNEHRAFSNVIEFLYKYRILYIFYLVAQSSLSFSLLSFISSLVTHFIFINNNMQVIKIERVLI